MVKALQMLAETWMHWPARTQLRETMTFFKYCMLWPWRTRIKYLQIGYIVEFSLRLNVILCNLSYSYMYVGRLIFILLQRDCLLVIWVITPKLMLFEPRHEISNNVVRATSKASDQPAHTRSLIRAFASRLNIQWVLSYWLNIIWSC